jgi:NAD(P)H-hydrate epimerase
VLTGVILGLLAQGYPSEVAAVLGVWLHGSAGDVAAESQSKDSMLAGDLIKNLGAAFQELAI